MKLAKIVKRCRIDKPERFRLADHDSAQTFGLTLDKDEVKPLLAEGIARLSDLQDRLYAEDRWALLVQFQVSLLKTLNAEKLLDFFGFRSFE
jgi:hypothetical protein